MRRAVQILPESCKKGIVERLAGELEQYQSSLLFLVESKPAIQCSQAEAHSSPSDQSEPGYPLLLSGALPESTGRAFVEFFEGRLLYPDCRSATELSSEFLPSDGQLPAGMGVLHLQCGESSLCCLRAGKLLSQFATESVQASRMVVFEKPAEVAEGVQSIESKKVAPNRSAGIILADILRARSQPDTLDRLRQEADSALFLAAAYVSLVCPSQQPSEVELQDLRNRSLQNWDN